MSKIVSAARRLRQGRWFPLVWLIPVGLLALGIAVVVARALRDLPGTQQFLLDYPGFSALPADAPVGLPAWLGWQHFINMFLLVFIVRSGLQIRYGANPKLTRATWTQRRSADGRPVRLGLLQWWHLNVDALWLLNGLIFYVVLVATGQWMRVVPTNWDVIPNAVSAGLQYLSLDWPLESGWSNYNALQLCTYFVTIFVAAPLAVAAGVRMIPFLTDRLGWFGRMLSLRVARTIHFAVMIWFVAFTAVHVTLVLSTGALRNLNHIYTASDDDGWLGLAVFALSLIAVITATFATTPTAIKYIGSLSGSVNR